MFENRAPGDRFFARIRRLDMECPRCGEVFHCTGKSKSAYQPEIGQFCCLSCGLTLALGVIAYPVTTSNVKRPASDWVPTYTQALAIRNQMAGVIVARAKGWTDPKNVVVREGCRCQLKARGLIVHPLCPIHGPEQGSATPQAQQSPAGTDKG